MEIEMESLRAQCEAFEQNLMSVNELLRKERDEHGIVYHLLLSNCNLFLCKICAHYLDKLKEEFVNEKHNLNDLKTQFNAYKETNKALEEQIRDLQVI